MCVQLNRWMCVYMCIYVYVYISLCAWIDSCLNMYLSFYMGITSRRHLCMPMQATMFYSVIVGGGWPAIVPDAVFPISNLPPVDCDRSLSFVCVFWFGVWFLCRLGFWLRFSFLSGSSSTSQPSPTASCWGGCPGPRSTAMWTNT